MVPLASLNPSLIYDNALMSACALGCLSVVRVLLEDGNADPATRGNYARAHTHTQ